MGCEIERKFLVRDSSWKALAESKVLFRQGYVRTACPPRVTVRIRIAGDAAFLTLKGPVTGISRAEFEYPVPVTEAEEMFLLFTPESGRIEKYRYFVPAKEGVWEIDEFLGDNQGLVVAELELASSDAEFERPLWLGREVTGLSRYYNSALAARPWKDWTPEERES